MPSSSASTWGARAEKAAARKFGLTRRSTENFDLVNLQNGFRYQVKSTEEYDDDGSPGRVRIWKSDFEAVRSQPGTFILVTYNPRNEQYPINKIWKVPAGKIADAVAGEWYDSGHADKGQQFKLRWSEVR